MSQQLQRYEDNLPQIATDEEEVASTQHRSNPLLRLLSSARRHWLSVTLIWVLLAGPATGVIWTRLKPTFTASAHVEVAPSLSRVLYQDEETQIMPAFDAYLNTQAQEIAGSTVLRAALGDESLKGLPLLSAPDPMAALREALTVGPIPKTHLLRVNVKQDNPDAAIRIAKAVMNAYRDYAIESEGKAKEKNRRILNTERERLKNELDATRKQIHDLAQPYGTSSESTFDTLRQTIAQASVLTQQEREKAEVQRAQLQKQLEQLEAGAVPTTMPAEETVLQEMFVEQDPMVRSLREELQVVSSQIARSGSTQVAEQKKARLAAQLDRELERAAEEAAGKVELRRQQRLDEARERVRRDLAAAEALVQTLDKRIQDKEREGVNLGRDGLKIKQLQEQAEVTKKEYDRVDERLRQLDIEKERPTRISVDPNAEILPGGVEDKRLKLSAVAIMGPLFFGIFLAFLRDHLSGRLFVTDDIQGSVGLRLLGTLPALEDLRRGRVTETDFRESYRAIRATLAGASGDGRIPKTLLVTSAQAAEGKTSLALSLAASLAETGCRVLLIDGDVQAPRVGLTLKVQLPYTLRHVLLGERKLQDAVGTTPVPSLDVLLSGRNGSSAIGLLTSKRAADLLKTAAQDYDHVIIDSPPALGAADALIWAQVAEGVVLSSFAGHSNMKIMRRVCERVGAVGGKILGAVMCNVAFHDHYSSYSYYSSLHSGSGGHGEPQTTAGGRTPPYMQLPGGQSEPAEPVEAADRKKRKP